MSRTCCATCASCSPQALTRTDANFDHYSSPLNEATERGHVAVMEVLLNAGARDADKALCQAAGCGHVPAAALLLARGANIHDDDDFALRHAAREGQLEMVAFLLDNGVDLHARNVASLQLALEAGHTAVVALLLQRAGA